MTEPDACEVGETRNLKGAGTSEASAKTGGGGSGIGKDVLSNDQGVEDDGAQAGGRVQRNVPTAGGGSGAFRDGARCVVRCPDGQYYCKLCDLYVKSGQVINYVHETEIFYGRIAKGNTKYILMIKHIFTRLVHFFHTSWSVLVTASFSHLSSRQWEVTAQSL